MKSSKSRRLQKKLYLGEFAILGFELSCDFDFKSEDDFNQLVDELIEFAESRELSMSGGGDLKSLDAFLCSHQRYGSATAEDQAAVKAWLESKAGISNVEVGELEDVNYGK